MGSEQQTDVQPAEQRDVELENGTGRTDLPKTAAFNR